jgi:hypothetical protein
VVSALLVLGACAVSRVDPMSVPLLYTPNSTHGGVIGALACNVLSQIQVSDARSDKTLGTRVHESMPLKAEVTSASDAATGVQNGCRAYSRRTALRSKGAVRSSVSRSIHCTRTKVSGIDPVTMRASPLSATCRAPRGQVCWNETVQGSGGNYGYAGSIYNYQQTLNGALDAASVNLAQSPGFKDALCKCGN